MTAPKKTTLKPILILAGPTASGKTDLALFIATKIDAVIINADSKQIYKEIPIITAQPTKEEQEIVPHMLYGNVPAKTHCSLAMWAELAVEAINKAHAQGKIPLLVGGTGMYIKNLMYGQSPIPETLPEIREKSIQLLEKLGNETFYQELVKLDPAYAKNLNPGDSHRILRAYEVIKQTGKSLLEWHDQPAEIFFPEEQFKLFFLSPQREIIYENCNKRFEKMVKNGVIEEIKQLDKLQLKSTLPAMKSHGVPELLAYLHNKMSLEEAMEIAQKNTRHYIKRQFTWFKHQFDNKVILDKKTNEANAKIIINNL